MQDKGIKVLKLQEVVKSPQNLIISKSSIQSS